MVRGLQQSSRPVGTMAASHLECGRVPDTAAGHAPPAQPLHAGCEKTRIEVTLMSVTKRGSQSGGDNICKEYAGAGSTGAVTGIDLRPVETNWHGLPVGGCVSENVLYTPVAPIWPALCEAVLMSVVHLDAVWCHAGASVRDNGFLFHRDPEREYSEQRARRAAQQHA